MLAGLMTLLNAIGTAGFALSAIPAFKETFGGGGGEGLGLEGGFDMGVHRESAGLSMEDVLGGEPSWGDGQRALASLRGRAAGAALNRRGGPDDLFSDAGLRQMIEQNRQRLSALSQRTPPSPAEVYARYGLMGGALGGRL